MKRLNLFLLIFLATTLTLYLSLWGYMYWRIDQKIAEIYPATADKQIQLLGSKPIITGFPGPPTVFFAGAVKNGDLILTFPEARLHGYMIPYLPVTLSFPQGIKASGPVDPTLWSLDRLSFDLIVPWSMPEEAYEEDLRAWQNQNGKIDVRNLTIEKQGLVVSGDGTASLDQELQPTLQADFKIQGYQNFMTELQKNKIIRPGEMIGASLVLSGLARPDPQTGVSTLNLPVTISGRLLSVGPLQLVRLPPYRWDRRNPPDRRQ